MKVLGHKWDIVIVDEAHHIAASTYQKILKSCIENNQLTKIIGFTATPNRTDDKGLGLSYIISQIKFADMLEEQRLVPPTFYKTCKQDVKTINSISVKRGEFDEQESCDLLTSPEWIKFIYQNWIEKASHRKTVCFCVNRYHAALMAKFWNWNGHDADFLVGGDDGLGAARDKISAGEFNIVFNCMILTEGWDCPSVDCIMLARPTRSEILSMQMIGRGLRKHQGKKDCLVLDFTGTVGRLVDAKNEIILNIEKIFELPAIDPKFNKKKKQIDEFTFEIDDDEIEQINIAENIQQILEEQNWLKQRYKSFEEYSGEEEKAMIKFETLYSHAIYEWVMLNYDFEFYFMANFRTKSAIIQSRKDKNKYYLCKCVEGNGSFQPFFSGTKTQCIELVNSHNDAFVSEEWFESIENMSKKDATEKQIKYLEALEYHSCLNGNVPTWTGDLNRLELSSLIDFYANDYDKSFANLTNVDDELKLS
jgi:hypothetical protein